MQKNKYIEHNMVIRVNAMKRIASLMLVGLIVFAGFVSLLSPMSINTNAQSPTTRSTVTLPFYDSFEDIPNGDYPSEHGWYMLWGGASTPYVTTGNAYNGNKYLVLDGDPGWIRCDGVNLSLHGVSALTYEFAVKIPSYSSSSGWVGFFVRLSSATSTMYNSVRFGHDHYIYVRGSEGTGTNTNIIWSKDVWYHVRVVINYNSQLMDVYLNGNKIASGIQAATPDVSSIFAIATTNYEGSGSGIVYYDAIKIYASGNTSNTLSGNGGNPLSQYWWLFVIIAIAIIGVIAAVLLLRKPPQQYPPPQQMQPPPYQQTGYPPPPPPQSMGMITVTCPYCGFTSQVPESMRGQWVQCPNCGNQFRVP